MGTCSLPSLGDGKRSWATSASPHFHTVVTNFSCTCKVWVSWEVSACCSSKVDPSWHAVLVEKLPGTSPRLQSSLLTVLWEEVVCGLILFNSLLFALTCIMKPLAETSLQRAVKTKRGTVLQYQVKEAKTKGCTVLEQKVEAAKTGDHCRRILGRILLKANLKFRNATNITSQ